MTQSTDGMRKTFIAGEELQPFRRVKVSDASTSPKTVTYADATDQAVAVTEAFVESGKNFSAKLVNGQGTFALEVTGAITGGNSVYAAADGKGASSGTVVVGQALETTTASGDLLECLPLHNSDISTAIVGTTYASFEVDNDSSTPKLAIAGQSGGTGDYTTTIVPETTLSADNTIICPESDGDTLAALALAQTFTARKGFTGNVANTAGVGITGTATSFVTHVSVLGTVIKTEILIDLTGLNSGGTADDIIGADGAGVAHLGQITAAVNGTIIAGRLTCLETPATGDDDIDVYSATESTGVEDTAVGDLTETQLCNSGDLTAGTVVAVTPPAANQYLYLVGGTGGSATYSAGILLLEFWGKSA
jgi:hypothetical protein